MKKNISSGPASRRPFTVRVLLALFCILSVVLPSSVGVFARYTATGSARNFQLDIKANYHITFDAESGGYSGIPYGAAASLYIGSSTALTSIKGNLDNTGLICTYILETDGANHYSVTYRGNTVTGSYSGKLYKSLPIGILNNNGQKQYTSAKLYSFRLTDNDILVRDMIPCKAADGKIGMYDRKSGVFYGNAGSGTFIEGPGIGDGSPDGMVTFNEDGTAVIWTPFTVLTALWEEVTE